MGNFNRGGGFGRNRNFSKRDFGRGGREMFKTVCSNCGKECEVPFRPTNGKPVYCSDCFEKMGGGRSEPRRFDDRNRNSQTQHSPDLGAINAKLDKILSILEPKGVTPATPNPVVEDKKTVKEIKPEKVKKPAKKKASTKKK
jgi:CxxC-x17-CxxC domain-containing protein